MATKKPPKRQGVIVPKPRASAFPVALVEAPPSANMTDSGVFSSGSADTVEAVGQPLAAAKLPVADVVVTQRRLMLEEKKESRALRFGVQDFPFPHYPYAKGPDLANDSVAYGEVLQMTIARVVGGSLNLDTGFSRRTRSGRQVVPEQVAQPAMIGRKVDPKPGR